MSLDDKTKKRIFEGSNGNREVTVVTTRLTEEEAREMFLYRPSSKYSESRFGGNTLVDDACLLLNELAHRCEMCRAPTKKEYLIENVCPDCDGRSEYNGTDPRASVR